MLSKPGGQYGPLPCLGLAAARSDLSVGTSFQAGPAWRLPTPAPPGTASWLPRPRRQAAPHVPLPLWGPFPKLTAPLSLRCQLRCRSKGLPYPLRSMNPLPGGVGLLLVCPPGDSRDPTHPIQPSSPVGIWCSVSSRSESVCWTVARPSWTGRQGAHVTPHAPVSLEPRMGDCPSILQRREPTLQKAQGPPACK